MTTSTPSNSIHHDAAPSEVGWQFVSQYYLFVHKQPHLLHLFYNKASTLIRGTEGEDDATIYGQKSIFDKFTAIGFRNTKVFIHSVDAQSSANGGILIQVIGQMSNDGDPNYHKFVQTFFLAEQPNGYFVLNDVFRFLKEETVDSDDDADQEVEVPQQQPVAATANKEPTVTAEPLVTSDEPGPTDVAAPATPPAPLVVEEPPVAPATVPVIPDTVAAPSPDPIPEPQPQPNGIHHNTIADAEPTTEPLAPPTEKPVPSPTAPSPAPPPTQAPPPTAPVQPVQPAAGPPAPKTWANLAAQNPKKWGAAVAQESRGTTEVPVATSATVAPSGTQSPSSHHGPNAARGSGGQHGQREHPAFVAAQAITTAQIFAKGVIEPVSSPALTQLLTTRFGPIKDLEIVRSKACAFLEFLSLDAAKKAIIASLPHSQGGEGGVFMDVGGETGQVRIVIETKKERGDRPVSRPRGGAPMNGDSRGGNFRGRGGPGGGRGRAGAGGK